MIKEVENWLNTVRSAGTKKSYRTNIEAFFEYKNINSFEEFKQMDADDYYDWIDYLMNEKGNTENTVRPKISALSSFYSYLLKNPKYDITINPITNAGIHSNVKATVNPERTTWLTAKEMHSFMKQCKNPRETAICGIFLNTGLRVSEVINLDLNKYEQFINEDGENCSRILAKRKGGKLQIIEFNPYVTELINNYLKVRKETECEKLFVSNAGNPMSRQSIDRTIHKLQKRANINRSISAHSLRRSAATAMYGAGFDIKEIQSVLGHSSSGTTDIYLKGLDDRANHVFQNFVIKGE